MVMIMVLLHGLCSRAKEDTIDTQVSRYISTEIIGDRAVGKTDIGPRIKIKEDMKFFRV